MMVRSLYDTAVYVTNSISWPPKKPFLGRDFGNPRSERLS